jgi:hypothetical protein
MLLFRDLTIIWMARDCLKPMFGGRASLTGISDIPSCALLAAWPPAQQLMKVY